MNKLRKKGTTIPSLMVIVSSIALLAIATITRTTWERTSIWMFLLATLSLAPFFVPSTGAGKSAVCSLALLIPLSVLALFVATNGIEGSVIHAGSATPLFGIALALLVFAGRKKNVLWILVIILFSMVFAYVLYERFRVCYPVFLIITSTMLVLVASSVSSWLGSDWKLPAVSLSIVSPVAVCFPLWADDTSKLTDYLAGLAVTPFPVSYLDTFEWDSIQEHLARMCFIGRTYPLYPNGTTEAYYYPLFESRLLVILGHRIGWCTYLLVGLLIAALLIALILLAIRRRGLGRLFALSAIGVVVLPLVLFFLTNLGVFEAETQFVPLLTGNFASNILSALLLRLAITFRPDPKCYFALDEGMGSIFDNDEEEDESNEEGNAGSIGELRVIAVPADECVETICRAFSNGQIEIPFKRDLGMVLRGKELLFARYSGDLGDIVGIFDQLKLQGEDHFIRVAVAEGSNISRLLLGVERVTEAISNQEHVDYCVCIDEDIPKNTFAIQVVSTKNSTDI